MPELPKRIPNTINVVTLGCSKNLVDSEVLMRQINSNNINVVHDSNQPTETVVINTCGFIVDAKQESIDTILQFARAKKEGLVKNIFVMGCLSQRYKEELQKEIPEVDGYFGVDELPQILQKLNIDYKKELIGERLISTPSHYAYLKIAEGCDRSCSFCAIPAIRGKHLSKSIENIVTEAEFLASKGVKELILISQDLSYYGVDRYKRQALPDLLEKLVEVDGIRWVRLHYLYPASFPWKVIELMKKHDKICNYIDIPLQHIHDDVLHSMKRGTGSTETEKLVDRIRNTFPQAAIRTAFIVGYPGEGRAEFEALKAFVKKYRFERMGVFTYSQEEGTAAEKLGDAISEKTKESRKNQLMLIQEEISLENNTNLIGKEFTVLIDKKEGDYYIGRTEFDSPEVDNEVLVEAKQSDIIPGKFYRVRITKADAFDLFGEVSGSIE